MPKDEKFIGFIRDEQRKCEKYLLETDAYEKVPETEKLESEQIMCYLKLGIIYKYLANENKSTRMFHHLTTFGFGVSTSRFDIKGLTEKDKKDSKVLIGIGKGQLRNGVYFNLSNTNPKKAKQLFEWAAENCLLSDEYIADEIEAENFDDIAVPFLWRGYALLVLGRYEEARELLGQVISYFNKYKKSGGEVWQKVEYFLPKALVPLCEYKLSPTNECLQKAKTGIDDFIDSLRDNKDKLEGYLYYFHLKDSYADVYGAKVAGGESVALSKAERPVAKSEFLSSHYDTRGKVIVFNREGGYLEELGSNNEFEAYVEKVRRLGGYPVLSGLMEIYVAEGEQEPEPLIEECARLLSRPDIDPLVREKTKLILEVAENARETGSTVTLYFEPEA